MRQISGIVLAAVAAVVTVSGSSVAGADDGPSRSDVETASVAIPGTPGANAQDESTRYRRANSRAVRADSVATATSDCDGCSASAVTLQIVYAHNARTLTADNVATAWSTCTNCSATALSVQVVISRQAGTITAANRSLALNAVCVGCETTAAAIQIVIVSPHPREPSRSALARSEALRDQLQAQLHPASRAHLAQPTTPTGRAAPTTTPVPPAMTTTTEQIQSILAADLRATSARHDIQLRAQ